MGMVSANLTATLLPCSRVMTEREISGPLLIAKWSGDAIKVVAKTALKSGSSKHGKARRQSVDCI